MLCSLSAIAFAIENLFPPIFLAGARLGISNIFILLCTIMLGAFYGYSSLIIKVLLGSLFSGNISSIIYSLPAGLVSLSIEIFIFYFIKNASIVCASVCGAVINSAIQNIMFCLVTNTSEYLVYLPYLSLISIISGLVVGFSVYLIIKYIPRKYIVEEEN